MKNQRKTREKTMEYKGQPWTTKEDHGKTKENPKITKETPEKTYGTPRNIKGKPRKRDRAAPPPRVV